MSAFVRASTLTPDDPEAYFGVGFAYRLQTQCQQAIPQLRKAIELRPDYYNAQRELASCYFVQGQTDQAIRQYQVVSSQRRKTKNSDEMAANNLALASAYRKKGEEIGGVQGEEYKKASKGYESDAREYDPTLKGAVKKLKDAGISNFIQNLLPDDARRESESDSPSGIKIKVPGKGGVTVPKQLLDKVPGKVPGKVLDKVPGNVLEKIPGLSSGKDGVKEPKAPEKGKIKIPKGSLSDKLKDSISLPVKGSDKGKEPEKKPSKSKGNEPVRGSLRDSLKTPKVQLNEKAKEPEKKSVKEPVKLPVKQTVKKTEKEPEKESLKLPVKKLLFK
jgi:hypothetical protein